MNNRLMFGLAFLAIFAMVTAVRCDVTLVEDGKPVAEIVVPKEPNPSVKLAVADLRKYLKLMSGAELPVVETPSKDVKSHVYVGDSEFTRELGVTVDDLKGGGFKIVTKGDNLILVGHDVRTQPRPYSSNHPESLKKWREFAGEKYTFPSSMVCFNRNLNIHHDDDTATLFAVSELLERLGIRFYHPYENGTVIPEKKTIVVPDMDLRKEPRFPYRYSTYYGTMRSDDDGLMWFKRLKYGVAYGLLIGHTIDDVLGCGDQKEDHPEYFARVKGKLVNVPKLTNPNFRKSSMNFLDKIMEAWPSMKVVNVQMPDGLGGIDEEDAKIWERPDGGYRGRCSDYVWDYWLHVAEELKKSHPDKLLRCNSYAPYAEPPAQVDKLPDNVALCIAENTATSFLPSSPVKENRAKWLPKLTSKKLYVWDYYLFYRPNFPRYPVVFTKHLQQDMQALDGVCEGKIIEIWADPGKGLACPGLTHMLHYLQGKLYWDPDLDLQALLDEYYELYFGPAKAEMKEFYEFAEEVWTRPESRSVTRTGGFMRKEDADRFFDLLKRAREKAGEGTVYDQRIAEIEEEMAPLKTQFENLNRTGPYLHVYTPARYGLKPDIDGDLEKDFWTKHRFWQWYEMGDIVTGDKPDKNGTSVSFRMPKDRSALIIGVVCHESKMDRLASKKRDRDDPNIADDDSVEIFIVTPERSYFRVVVNAEGTVWDECHDPVIVERDTLPKLWNPDIEVVVKKFADRWTVEMAVPTEDLGLLGPSRNYPWGINVCRMRRAGGEEERFALAPTGKNEFFALSKMGDLASGDYAGGRWRGKADLAGFPGDFQLALDLFKKKEFQKASDAFSKLAATAPTTKSKGECLGHAAVSLGKLKRCDEALALARTIDDKPISINCQMEIMLENKKFKELIEAFKDEDIDAWPDSLIHNGLYDRGTAFRRTGDHAAAAKDLEKAAAVSATTDERFQLRLLNELGDAYMALKDDAKALVAHQKAVAFKKLEKTYPFTKSSRAIAEILARREKRDETTKDRDGDRKGDDK